MANNKPAASFETIINFVLQKASDEPLENRVRLLRSLADMTGDAEKARSLLAIADEMLQAEKKYQEFVFAFRN